MPNRFSTIQEAVEAIARGEVIIVVDAEDRENEGDYVCAAEKATAANVNFMLSGRGMLCMPILPDACRRLKLTPLVETNTAALGTNFVTPIDFRTSKTGITAEERATTIREVIDETTRAEDFTRPGHVHPLVAKEGGVLRRAGHTEAAVDLARMAGLYPAGVVCEILNEAGDRANLPTKYGEFDCLVYDVAYESQQPVVLKMGELDTDQAPLVRLHSSCFTGDLISSLRCDCGDQLQMALEHIGKEGQGVLVYLPQEGRGIGLAQKIKAYALQDQGMDTVEANHALGFKADMRDYGVGMQILKDLGLRNVRLLTNNPKKTDAFIYGGFDIKIVDQIPLAPPMNEHNRRYLETKRDKMGHHLP